MRKLVVLLCLLLIGSEVLAQQTVVVPDELVRWDGESRFNILVLGMDRRPGARDNLNARTDAIMLVSFDPVSRRLGVLDIPRDIHLAVIDVADELVRINTLMVRGESRAEGYGPYFAMETLQLNLGMYVDAYIAFDFEAFIDFIDFIGGVTIDVPYDIYDPSFPDMNYGYDPLYLAAGVQTLDGRDALRYARTRHGDNDYMRGQRQLQVLLAARDRLSDPLVSASMVRNAPQLFNNFRGHFYTNIQPEHLVYLGLSMLELSADDIATGSLNTQYSFNYNYRNQTVRVPDRDLLGQLLIDVFGVDYWR